MLLAAAAAAQTGTGSANVHRVEMKDIAFVPAEVSAHVGDRIEWHNGDIVDHTATSEAAGFDVVVASGRSEGAVLTRAGTFTYSCRYHPNMTGHIRVQP
jgi:plastocyanin